MPRPPSRRELASHAQKASGTDQHGHRPAEHHNLSVQPDTARYDRTQPQQRGQVEDVRAEDDPGANGRLVVHQCGDRGRDLRRVGSQGGHHPEQSFG